MRAAGFADKLRENMKSERLGKTLFLEVFFNLSPDMYFF